MVEIDAIVAGQQLIPGAESTSSGIIHRIRASICAAARLTGCYGVPVFSLPKSRMSVLSLYSPRCLNLKRNRIMRS
ncbi:MAG: hypothetical protein RLZ98_3324 [Pseudomonadota bacterium]